MMHSTHFIYSYMALDIIMVGDHSNSETGQVRSECLMGVFRASCCSARLSWAQVPAFDVSSVRDRSETGNTILI